MPRLLPRFPRLRALGWYTLMAGVALLPGIEAPGEPEAGPSQGIAGVWSGIWQGTLAVPGGGELRLVLHLRPTTPSSEDELTATLDSPDQGAAGIPVERVTAGDGRLLLDLPALRAGFEGRLGEDGRVAGIWRQGGLELPLVLERAPSAPRPRRPQEPSPPYPYRREEVTYPNPEAGIELAATLTLPPGGGPFPAVLLLSGSGPQDRDETLFGHRPFLVLADHLTRRGIAVLRADDRGVGGSGGSFGEATMEDFVTDALAGVRYLAGREEIHRRAIGLAGHSEGALVGAAAAARSEEVAFLVMLAGPGLPGEQILLAQAELLGRAAGHGEAERERAVEIQRQLLAAIRAAEGDGRSGESLRDGLAEILRRGRSRLEEDQRQALTDEAIAAQAEILASPWYRHFVTWDPRPTFRRLDRRGLPVLALAGGKDLQVPAEENLAAIREALGAGGCGDFEARRMPDLNHLLQRAETGSPAEYGRIEETLAPEVLNAVSRWILARFPPPPADDQGEAGSGRLSGAPRGSSDPPPND